MPKPPPSSGIFRLCLANRFPPWKPLGAPFTFSFHPSAVSPPRAFTLSLTAAVYFKGGTSGCRGSNDGSLWSARRAIRIFARLAPVISHLDSKMTVYASDSTGGRFARTFRFSHEEYWWCGKGKRRISRCASAAAPHSPRGLAEQRIRRRARARRPLTTFAAARSERRRGRLECGSRARVRAEVDRRPLAFLRFVGRCAHFHRARAEKRYAGLASRVRAAARATRTRGAFRRPALHLAIAR